MKVYLKLFMKVFVEMVSLKVVGDVDVILDIEEFVEVGDICNEFSEEWVGVEPGAFELEHG